MDSPDYYYHFHLMAVPSSGPLPPVPEQNLWDQWNGFLQIRCPANQPSDIHSVFGVRNNPWPITPRKSRENSQYMTDGQTESLQQNRIRHSSAMLT